MALPVYLDSNTNLMALQTNWKRYLDPILSHPINNGLILENVNLSSGINTINHTLGRALQGWIVVRQNAAATFYDNQSANIMPALTLILHASGTVTIAIYVF